MLNINSLRFAIVIFFSMLCYTNHAFAQPDLKNQLIYHDADELEIEPKTGNVIADGHALFLVGDVFISAEKITILRSQNLATAEGNVRLVKTGEEIEASRIIYDLKTAEMRITNARFVADPNIKSREIINSNVLNITDAEVAFEAARQERQEDLKQELLKLRQEYVALKNLSRIKKTFNSAEKDKLEKIRIRYVQTLERLQRTRWQTNIELATIPEDVRKKLMERRTAVAELIKSTPNLKSQNPKLPGYFAMSAEEVIQKADGTYKLKNTTITSCHCDKDETPIFGFSARSANFEIEKYATLYGATINVMDVPVVYSPWLKFPIKSKRQTGLLIPSFYKSTSGDVYSFPFYMTLGESADTTITATHFQSRGTRAEIEARYALRADSRMRIYYDTVSDKQILLEGEKYKAKEQARVDAVQDPVMKQIEQDKLNFEMSQVHSRRWFTSGSWNVPIQQSYSLKIDAELASDNSYLSDYAQEAGTTQDLFSPNVSARRFLTQEGAVEYYGSDIVLSARIQDVQDLLAINNSETAYRMPRLEFFLLPRRYNGLPFIIEQSLFWERIARKDNEKFLDTDYSVDVFDPTGTTTSVRFGKDGRKDIVEPYQIGDRLFSESRATLPLPNNDYINASVGVKGTAIQYFFPATEPSGKVSPYQSYLTYEASANIPVYSKFKLETAESGGGYLRHDFVPSVSLSYIPSIAREEQFPNENAAFYLDDWVNPHQQLGFGFDSIWTIVRENYTEKEKALPRLSQQYDYGVANEDLFEEILESRNISPDSKPEDLLAFASTPKARDVFVIWAEKELKTYEEQINSQDFGDYYVWPAATSYQRTRQWQLMPFRLSVRSSYNFIAKQTENEINSRKRPGEKLEVVDPLSDIIAHAQSSLDPFLPLTLTADGAWRRKWDRFATAGVGATLRLPFGVSASASNGYTTLADSAEESFTLDRTVRFGLRYNPPQFKRFIAETQYEHQYKTKEKTSLARELGYKALQRISFIGIQDCIDVVFQRYKNKNVLERNAEWSIGINMGIGPVRRNLPEISRTFPQMKNTFNRESGPFF